MSEELNNKPQEEPTPIVPENTEAETPLAETTETVTVEPVVETPPPTSSYTSMYEQPTYDINNAVKPANNMVLAIISTVVSLFAGCCAYAGCIGFVVGIVAIVFASQVDSKFKAGDIDGAEASAKKAKTLSYVALATVVLSIIIWIIMFISMGGYDGYMERYNDILDQIQ